MPDVPWNAGRSKYRNEEERKAAHAERQRTYAARRAAERQRKLAALPPKRGDISDVLCAREACENRCYALAVRGAIREEPPFCSRLCFQGAAADAEPEPSAAELEAASI